MSGASTWRTERFTATVRCSSVIGSVPSDMAAWMRCHSTTSAHARSSNQAPMGTMRPLSSAIGMNSTGCTGPRPGCSHRSNASTLVIAPVTRSMTGW